MMHWAYILLIVAIVLSAIGISIWLFLLHYRDRNAGGKYRPECTDDQLQSMLLPNEYLDDLHHLIALVTAALKIAGMNAQCAKKIYFKAKFWQIFISASQALFLFSEIY